MESDMFLHIIKTPAIPHMLSQENTYHMQSICYCWCIVIYFCSSIYLVADMFLHLAPTTPHKLALENTRTKIYVIADALWYIFVQIYIWLQICSST